MPASCGVVSTERAVTNNPLRDFFAQRREPLVNAERGRPPSSEPLSLAPALRTAIERDSLAQGEKLGRPKIDSATERKVRKQLAGILKVAKSFSIGTGTVQRISKELR